MAHIDYIISVGGTGARCVEAFIHCMAAGMLGTDHHIKLVYVDPDDANGNLTGTQTTKEQYDRLFKSEIGKYTPFARASIEYITTSNIDGKKEEVLKKGLWNPRIDATTRTLEDEFQFSFLEPSEAKELGSVFFSNEEKDLNLKVGFRGQPAIGALYFSKKVNLEKDEWKNLFGEGSDYANSLMSNDDVRIFLVGSVFGGTGASGIPTIAKKLYSAYGKNKKFRMGTVMMLPYFGFNGGEEKELHAKAEEFSLKTKYALEYYEQQRQLNDEFNARYYVGHKAVEYETFSLGSNTQNNPALPAELIGALSLIDGFQRTIDQQEKYSAIISRPPKKGESPLGWDDLMIKNIQVEYENVKLNPANYLASFIRFAWVYSKHCYNTINNKINDCSWYTDTRLKDADSKTCQQFNELNEYFDSFLSWIKNMKNAKLINWKAETDRIRMGSWVNKKEAIDWRELLIQNKDDDFWFYEDSYKGSLDVKLIETIKENASVGDFYNGVYDVCKKDIKKPELEEFSSSDYIVKQWMTTQKNVNGLSVGQDVADVAEVKIAPASMVGIDSIAENMKVLDEVEKVDKLQALPDVWGRYVYFGEVMSKKTDENEDESLKKELLDEWRGLLALLALREVYGFKIRFKECNLNEVLPNEQQDTRVFYKSAYELLPENYKGDVTKEGIFYLIEYTNSENKTSVVGMLTPFSLVATCKSYAVNAFSGVKWARNNRLADPCITLKEDEKRLLYVWLKKCGNDIPKIKTVTGGFKHSPIKSRISDFMGDLCQDKKWNIDIPDPEKPEQVKIDNQGIELVTLTKSKARVENINYPELFYVKPFITMVKQYVELKLAGDLNYDIENYQECLVVSRTGEFNKKAEDIGMWGLLTLADYGENPASVKEQIAESVPVIDLDDVFMDTIHYKGGISKSMHSCMKIEDEELMILLPVKEEYEQLVAIGFFDKIQFKTSDNSIILTFDIKYKENNLIQTYTKEYTKMNQIPINNQIPDVFIWPNCVVEPNNLDGWKPWKQYYLYGEQVESFTKKFIQKEEAEQEKQQYKEYTENNRKKEYYKLTDYPTAIALRSKRTDILCGYYVIDVPKKVIQNGDSIHKIGLDFGSSSTTLSIRGENVKVPDALRFNRTIEDEYVGVINFGGGEGLILGAEQEADFIKEMNEGSTTFNTVYQLFDTTMAKEHEPLVDGHIVCKKDSSQLATQNVYASLKWAKSSETQKRKAREGFLRQTLLQTAWEAKKRGCDKIDLFVSYPSVLIQNNITSYVATIQQSLKHVCQLEKTGVEINAKIQNITEDCASAVYWENQLGGIAVNDGIISIDIGGGTTDIGIIFNPTGTEKHFFSGKSMKLAGQRIYLDNYYYYVPQQKISTQTTGEAVNATDMGAEIEALERLSYKSTKEQEKYLLALEVFLGAMNDENIIADHIIGRGDQDEVLNKLYRCTLLGICSVLYYTGLMIKQVNDKTEKQMNPHICFGGNGSRIVNYLYGGESETNRAAIEHIFKEIVTVASGNANVKTVQLSESPKSEVVKGMVKYNESKIKAVVDKRAEQKDISGLKWTTVADGEIRGEDTNITESDIDKIILLHDLTPIKVMCQTLARAYRERFSEEFIINGIKFEEISENELEEIKIKTDGKLQAMQQGGIPKELTPLFILAIDCLLEKLQQTNV